MSDSQELGEIRDRIDAIDLKIMELISERAKCAQKVASIKRAHDPDARFYRPEREAQVLRRIKALNPGPVDAEEMARLFREIMSVCLALEETQTVAYLGPEGTFTHAATLKHFGHSVEPQPMAAINEVFREVESGSCEYGVVPVENSTEGMVNHTLDSFLQSQLGICGEVELRIHQNLLSQEDEFKNIARVYSHPQSLAQCREWLDMHLPYAERITISSNAEAARKASEEQGSAAIAGETAAELYGITIRQRNIEDNPDNTTRFLIIGNQHIGPSGNDKTSLLVSTRNRPGALHDLLSSLADNGVSLTRIESRPSQCVNWEYVFFLDLEGHVDDENISQALTQLDNSADMVRVLGSYPRGVL
ncbi:MAG: prephenate dehydratase [bacterium]